MNVLEMQVIELSDKVDSLHSLMAQLTEKVNATITSGQDRFATTSKDILPDANAVNLSPTAMRRAPNPSMMHKDVLSDDPYLEGESLSTTRTLSPEIQIQRLTAQLTAAYNRIAALEEQIMAYRSY
ncbi:hypothetical protein [cf. Phormidesmis sp. LEGE 11477]|uniref:hypothetical protein n=1 Tax=cf. Phormidesmis sp. LEGE 11477 TaxID=1828680 RepID=UPI00187F13C7|nr:hypothetical protein [cf. Phormidesmis sp. LEGE 11477]